MIIYKLTDKDGYTRRGQTGETLWAPGVIKETSGEGDLCTSEWTHAYEHPILAILHDPIHGDFGGTARMWECDTMDGVIKRDGQMKLGTSKLKVLREIKKPEVTLEQRISYAISCSLRVYVEESYVLWAEGWLSGKDRSKKAAARAAKVAARVGRMVCPSWKKVCPSWAAEQAASQAACELEWCAVWKTVCAAWYAEMAWYVKNGLDLLDCAREVYLVR